MAQLDWQITDNTLYLTGELDIQSTVILWNQCKTLRAEQITAINVMHLSRIDSAGLSLIIYLSFNIFGLNQLKLEGVSDELAMLIELYNLRQLTNE